MLQSFCQEALILRKEIIKLFSINISTHVYCVKERGRWEEVFRMGNTCTPMADSCQCVAKTTTIL